MIVLVELGLHDVLLAHTAFQVEAGNHDAPNKLIPSQNISLLKFKAFKAPSFLTYIHNYAYESYMSRSNQLAHHKPKIALELPHF